MISRRDARARFDDTADRFIEVDDSVEVGIGERAGSAVGVDDDLQRRRCLTGSLRGGRSSTRG
jgi:hypothetical protein